MLNITLNKNQSECYRGEKEKANMKRVLSMFIIVSLCVSFLVPAVNMRLGKAEAPTMRSLGNNPTMEPTVEAAVQEPPSIEWNKTYGGTGDDQALALVRTDDGGYALAGYTSSFGAGGQDFWFVKTNSEGKQLWNRTYGTGADEVAWGLIETSDKGFALAGHTTARGNLDLWLVRTDSEGNMLWNVTYGGTDEDVVRDLVQADDGGFVLVGHTASYPSHGYTDVWMVKINSTGGVEWSRNYGGSRIDQAWEIIKTNDGGYAVAAFSNSWNLGEYDLWLIKLNASGIMEWSALYGGTGDDSPYSMVQTSDGRYAIAGFTTSYGAGHRDFWLVRIDSQGEMLWNKTYGGTGDDWAYGLVQTIDGGFALAGYTNSFGAGGSDFWLFRTDSNGNELWNMTCGGNGNEWALGLVESDDFGYEGYALAGYTTSYGAGGRDFWFVGVVSPHAGFTCVHLSANPVSVCEIPGQFSSIEVTVSDQYGDPIPNASVAFTSSYGALSSTDEETDNQGKATVNLSPDNSTTSLLTASVTASANGVSASTEVILYPSSGPPDINWKTCSTFQIECVSLNFSSYLLPFAEAYNFLNLLNPSAQINITNLDNLSPPSIYLIDRNASDSQADYAHALSEFFNMAPPSGYEPGTVLVLDCPIVPIINVLLNANFTGPITIPLPDILHGLLDNTYLETTPTGHFTMAFMCSRCVSSEKVVTEVLLTLTDTVSSLIKAAHSGKISGLIHDVVDALKEAIEAYGDFSLNIVTSDLNQIGSLQSYVLFDLLHMVESISTISGLALKVLDFSVCAGSVILAPGWATTIAGAVVQGVDIGLELVSYIPGASSLADNPLYQTLETGVGIIDTQLDLREPPFCRHSMTPRVRSC